MVPPGERKTENHMNKIINFPMYAISLLLLSGCAAVDTHNIQVRQNKTSAVIGCAPTDIAIRMTGSDTWSAICRQKEFHCKIVPGVLSTSAACVPALQ